MLKCIEHDGCRELPKLLANDLEAPAIESHPEIAAIKTRLLAAGARGALRCGSGSAVFGLFESAEEATACDLSDCGAVYIAETMKGRTLERL
jgi:4-diphosphocytidyl-2-C-methyl-D-erythritol kinase